MHFTLRNLREYRDLVASGVTKGISYSVVYYRHFGWDALNTRNRLDVIRYRKARPVLCPHCGSAGVLVLYNISRNYLDDDADYDWCCRSCGQLKYIFKRETGTSRRLLRQKRKAALDPALPGHFFGRFA